MSTPQDRDDQLREQFQHLQDDWNSYKKSLTGVPCRRFSFCPSSSLPTTPTTTTSRYVAKSNYFDIIHDSPKMLVSSLQHPTTLPASPSTTTSPAPASSVAAETKAKRRAAYSGRLLLDELERAKDDSNDEEEEQQEQEVLTGLLCSVCSASMVVHGASEDGSYCSSCVGCECSVRQIGRFDGSSSSCSSSEDERVEGGDGADVKRTVSTTKLCFGAFVLLLAFWLSMVCRGFGFEEWRVPT